MLARTETPEERELTAKRAELAALEDQLTERELDLATLEAKAGVMMRQSLDPSSPHIMLDLKPDGGLELMMRSALGGDTTFIRGMAAPSSPVFLRLARRGEWVAAFISTHWVCSMGCNNWTMVSDGWIHWLPGAFGNHAPSEHESG